MSKRFIQFVAPAKVSVLNHGSKTISNALEKLWLQNLALKVLGFIWTGMTLLKSHV
jgi:hypothetical protein